MALLSILPSICSTSRLSTAKKLLCFLPGSVRGSFLSGLAQCQSHTLITPADKLLLSEPKKLGGHSAISGRYPQQELRNTFMPTIEIASINAEQLNINQSDFKIAIIEEQKLESHRGLFYDFLLENEGTILHLGNPEFIGDTEGGFWAGQLINWDYEPTNISIPHVDDELHGANLQFQFQFLPKFRHQIDQLLNFALEKSPVSKIYFLTDYQFGPDEANHERTFLISDLWEQHDLSGLTWNTLYELYGK